MYSTYSGCHMTPHYHAYVKSIPLLERNFNLDLVSLLNVKKNPEKENFHFSVWLKGKQ